MATEKIVHYAFHIIYST